MNNGNMTIINKANTLLYNSTDNMKVGKAYER
jgi:hypothetical protein